MDQFAGLIHCPSRFIVVFLLAECNLIASIATDPLQPKTEFTGLTARSTGATVNKRPLTPGYLFFYLIFWPDTYRILIGLSVAFFLAPRIMPPDQGWFGLVMMHIMLACMGYAASGKPARSISHKLKKMVLKNKLS